MLKLTFANVIYFNTMRVISGRTTVCRIGGRVRRARRTVRARGGIGASLGVRINRLDACRHVGTGTRRVKLGFDKGGIGMIRSW